MIVWQVELYLHADEAPETHELMPPRGFVTGRGSTPEEAWANLERTVKRHRVLSSTLASRITKDASP